MSAVPRCQMHSCTVASASASLKSSFSIFRRRCSAVPLAPAEPLWYRSIRQRALSGLAVNGLRKLTHCGSPELTHLYLSLAARGQASVGHRGEHLRYSTL